MRPLIGQLRFGAGPLAIAGLALSAVGLVFLGLSACAVLGVFASVNAYLAITIVLLGVVTNFLLLRSKQNASIVLLLVSMIISLIILAPIVYAAFDIAPHH